MTAGGGREDMVPAIVQLLGQAGVPMPRAERLESVVAATALAL